MSSKYSWPDIHLYCLPPFQYPSLSPLLACISCFECFIFFLCRQRRSVLIWSINYRAREYFCPLPQSEMQYALTTHRSVSLVYRLHGIGDRKVIFCRGWSGGWLALAGLACERKTHGSRDSRERASELTCLLCVPRRFKCQLWLILTAAYLSAQRSHFCATVFVFRSTPSVLPTFGNAPPAVERLHCHRRSWRTKRRVRKIV